MPSKKVCFISLILLKIFRKLRTTPPTLGLESKLVNYSQFMA